MDASVVFVALESHDGGHIEFAYDHGMMVRDTHVPILPESQTYRVMQTRQALLMPGPEDLPVHQVPLQIPGASKEDTASAIFVPLRFGPRFIGVLSVQSYKPHAYDAQDLHLLETCALYLAAGVQERAEGVATVDAVTRTPTRAVFEERFHAEWKSARDAGSSLAVIVLDLDRFKQFNATYGHDAGDSCLAQTAQAAQICASRKTDFFGRYGADEFAAILGGVSFETASLIAEQMRRAVAALQIPHAESPDTIVTASVGFAHTNAASGEGRAFLRCVDRALYAAKSAGGNRAIAETPRPEDESPHFDGNLPAQPGPTIGRAIELDALARSLALSRLTTLTGPAGVGKTHCALAVAHRLTNAYVHGAWFFDVTAARSAHELARFVHATLQDAASKHCLVVLDECDRLGSALAPVCDALLAEAPRMTILATSGAPIDSPHERVFHLAPFTRENARAFFAARAAAAVPGIIFDSAERAAILDVCARLGDLPLAIDLVAPLVKTRSVSELAASMPHARLDLGEVIEWTYGMLDDRAQRLLDRLSVFERAFDADAARDVCGFPPLRPGEAAAALEKLVDYGFVRVLQSEDRAHFCIPEPIAQFARAKLRGRDDLAATQQRYAAYFAGRPAPATPFSSAPRASRRTPFA